MEAVMIEHLNEMFNFLMDLAPEELIGAVMLALLLAAVMTGIYCALRRRKSDAATLLVPLMLVGNLAGMLVGASYIRTLMYGARFTRYSEGRHMPPPPFVGRFGGPGGPVGPGGFLTPQIMIFADLNNDGLISTDEARSAAAQFVEHADADKKGGVDAQTLARSINDRLRPPPHP
jgi:hypothetical protein